MGLNPALIGILLPAIVIKKKFIDVRSGGLRVIVSPEDGVRLESKKKGSGKASAISIAELEEIVLPEIADTAAATANAPAFVQSLAASATQEQAAITARSDRETISFGGHLPAEERRYIYALILQVLAS